MINLLLGVFPSEIEERRDGRELLQSDHSARANKCPINLVGECFTEKNPLVIEVAHFQLIPVRRKARPFMGGM